MAHFWGVYWAQKSPGPRGWKAGDPVAWLGAASAHWSWNYYQPGMPGILYSGPTSERFNAFDLYAMGLMDYAEVSRTVHVLYEDPRGGCPPPCSSGRLHDLRADDLIHSISLEGDRLFEPPGRRLPETDPSAADIRILIVVIKGRDDAFTTEHDQLLRGFSRHVADSWRTATWGRSTLDARLKIPSTFRLDAIPRGASVIGGGSAEIQVTATAVRGTFNQEVSLRCSNLPPQASCTFSPPGVVPGSAQAASILRLSTYSSGGVTPPASYDITVTGTSSSIERATMVTLSVNPQVLSAGQVITSDNGQFRLIYQSDGNLVLYDHRNQTALWSTNTAGTTVGQAIMQSDGNFVLYDGDGDARWASGTSGNPKAYLLVQNDGNIVVYSPDGRSLWDRFQQADAALPR